MSDHFDFSDRLSSAPYSDVSSARHVFLEEEQAGWLDPLLDVPIHYRLADVERGAQIEDVDARGLVP